MSGSQSILPNLPHLGSTPEQERRPTNKPAPFDAQGSPTSFVSAAMPFADSRVHPSRLLPDQLASGISNGQANNSAVSDRNPAHRYPDDASKQTTRLANSHPQHSIEEQSSLGSSLADARTYSDRETPIDCRADPYSHNYYGNSHTGEYGASKAHFEADPHQRHVRDETLGATGNDSAIPEAAQQVEKFSQRQSTPTFSSSAEADQDGSDTLSARPASGPQASPNLESSQEISCPQRCTPHSAKGSLPLDSNPPRACPPEHQDSFVAGDAPPPQTNADDPQESSSWRSSFYQFPPYSSATDMKTPPVTTDSRVGEDSFLVDSSEEIAADDHHDQLSAERNTRRKFYFDPESAASPTAYPAETAVNTSVFSASEELVSPGETHAALPNFLPVNTRGEQTPVAAQVLGSHPDCNTLSFIPYSFNQHALEPSSPADISIESSVSTSTRGQAQHRHYRTASSPASDSQNSTSFHTDAPSSLKPCLDASRSPPEQTEQPKVVGPLGREAPVNPNILVAAGKQDPTEASFFQNSPSTLSTKPYLASPDESELEMSDHASETGAMDSPRPRSPTEPEHQPGSKQTSPSAELDSHSEASSHSQNGDEFELENVLDEEEFMPSLHPSAPFEDASDSSFSDEELDHSYTGDVPTTHLSTITEVSESSPEAHLLYSLPRSPLSVTWPAHPNLPTQEESHLDDSLEEQHSEVRGETSVAQRGSGATGLFPSSSLGAESAELSSSQPYYPRQLHESISRLTEKENGPSDSLLSNQVTFLASRIVPQGTPIPHDDPSPAEPKDAGEEDGLRSTSDRETLVAFPERSPEESASTLAHTSARPPVPPLDVHDSTESRDQSANSVAGRKAQSDFLTEAALLTQNDLGLPSEQPDEPVDTDVPITADIERVDDAPIKSQGEAQTDDFPLPQDAESALEERSVATVDQREDSISVGEASDVPTASPPHDTRSTHTAELKTGRDLSPSASQNTSPAEDTVETTSHSGVGLSEPAPETDPQQPLSSFVGESPRASPPEEITAPFSDVSVETHEHPNDKTPEDAPDQPEHHFAFEVPTPLATVTIDDHPPNASDVDEPIVDSSVLPQRSRSLSTIDIPAHSDPVSLPAASDAKDGTFDTSHSVRQPICAKSQVYSPEPGRATILDTQIETVNESVSPEPTQTDPLPAGIENEVEEPVVDALISPTQPNQSIENEYLDEASDVQPSTPISPELHDESETSKSNTVPNQLEPDAEEPLATAQVVPSQLKEPAPLPESPLVADRFDIGLLHSGGKDNPETPLSRSIDEESLLATLDQSERASPTEDDCESPPRSNPANDNLNLVNEDHSAPTDASAFQSSESSPQPVFTNQPNADDQSSEPTPAISSRQPEGFLAVKNLTTAPTEKEDSSESRPDPTKTRQAHEYLPMKYPTAVPAEEEDSPQSHPVLPSTLHHDLLSDDQNKSSPKDASTSRSNESSHPPEFANQMNSDDRPSRPASPISSRSPEGSLAMDQIAAAPSEHGSVSTGVPTDISNGSRAATPHQPSNEDEATVPVEESAAPSNESTGDLLADQSSDATAEAPSSQVHNAARTQLASNETTDEIVETHSEQAEEFLPASNPDESSLDTFGETQLDLAKDDDPPEAHHAEETLRTTENLAQESPVVEEHSMEEVPHADQGLVPQDAAAAEAWPLLEGHDPNPDVSHSVDADNTRHPPSRQDDQAEDDTLAEEKSREHVAQTQTNSAVRETGEADPNHVNESSPELAPVVQENSRELFELSKPSDVELEQTSISVTGQNPTSPAGSADDENLQTQPVTELSAPSENRPVPSDTEAPDDSSFQGSATQYHAAQHGVSLQEVLVTSVDSSSARLPDEKSGTVVDTQDTKAEPQDIPEAATATPADASPAELESATEAELPNASDVVQNPETISPESEGLTEAQEPVSTPIETVVTASSNLDPEAQSQVNNEHMPPADSSPVPPERETQVDPLTTADEGKSAAESAAISPDQPVTSPPRHPSAAPLANEVTSDDSPSMELPVPTTVGTVELLETQDTAGDPLEEAPAPAAEVSPQLPAAAEANAPEECQPPDNQDPAVAPEETLMTTADTSPDRLVTEAEVQASETQQQDQSEHQPSIGNAEYNVDVSTVPPAAPQDPFAENSPSPTPAQKSDTTENPHDTQKTSLAVPVDPEEGSSPTAEIIADQPAEDVEASAPDDEESTIDSRAVTEEAPIAEVNQHDASPEVPVVPDKAFSPTAEIVVDKPAEDVESPAPDEEVSTRDSQAVTEEAPIADGNQDASVEAPLSDNASSAEPNEGQGIPIVTAAADDTTASEVLSDQTEEDPAEKQPQPTTEDAADSTDHLEGTKDDQDLFDEALGPAANASPAQPLAEEHTPEGVSPAQQQTEGQNDPSSQLEPSELGSTSHENAEKAADVASNPTESSVERQESVVSIIEGNSGQPGNGVEADHPTSDVADTEEPSDGPSNPPEASFATDQSGPTSEEVAPSQNTENQESPSKASGNAEEDLTETGEAGDAAELSYQDNTGEDALEPTPRQLTEAVAIGESHQSANPSLAPLESAQVDADTSQKSEQSKTEDNANQSEGTAKAYDVMPGQTLTSETEPSMATTVDSSSAQLENNVEIEPAPSDAANGEEEHKVRSTQPVEVVARELVSTSGEQSDPVDTQGTKAECGDTSEAAAAAIVDANPQPEGTIEAELLPSNTGAVKNPETNSEAAGGPNDAQQSASTSTEKEAEPANSDPVMQEVASESQATIERQLIPPVEASSIQAPESTEKSHDTQYAIPEAPGVSEEASTPTGEILADQPAKDVQSTTTEDEQGPDTDSVQNLAEKKTTNNLLATVDNKSAIVSKNLFPSYLPAFLDSPPTSSRSVPKPPIVPATAKIWPGAPVVSNIQREIILPARMKKISASSTSSRRTLFMKDLATLTFPLPSSQPPTPKPALNSDTSPVILEVPSPTRPCVLEPHDREISSSPPRAKSTNSRYHKLVKPYPSLKRTRATDSPDHRAWRSSYRSVTFRNKSVPSAADGASGLQRARSIKLSEFGLRPKSHKRQSTRLEQNNDLSDAFAIIEMSDATTYSPQADRYVNPTLSRRLSTSVKDIIQKRQNRDIEKTSPLDDVHIAEDFHFDIEKELAHVPECLSEDDFNAVEAGTAGPSVHHQNRNRGAENARRSVDSKQSTKASSLSDGPTGKKHRRIRSKLAGATITITDKILTLFVSRH